MGPAIGFGERMRELQPDKKIALLKYAYVGTNLHTQWAPGANNADTGNWGNQYTAFVNTINAGLSALEAEGWVPEIKGMLWIQGEEDAKSTVDSDAYGANLKHLIGRVREQFSAYAAPEGIRFVSGQVLPSNNTPASLVGRDAVRQGILNVDEDSGHALSVTNTKAVATTHAEYPMRSDHIHFNWESIFKMGRHMAYEMLELEEISYTDWATTHSLTGGEGDDDDKDGLSNVLEFTLGGDPNVPSDAPHPTTADVNIDGVIYPAYTLQRNFNASNTTVDVMYSADLGDWT
jgi:hypothetical protein